MTSVLEVLERELRRKELEEEAQLLSHSFKRFIRAAWPSFKPDDSFINNWHIDAIADHLEAVSRGEIRRLQVWVPPQSMKTTTVSIMWPAWEWTFRPSLKYWGASYGTNFSARIAAQSRDLMLSSWYQERWGHLWDFTRDAEHFFANSKGGQRLATSPESEGQGVHGHRILIDDPVTAQQVEKTSGAALQNVITWYDGTVETRGEGNQHARIIVMQRLHQLDLAEHVLAKEDWEILALPERYELNHPFIWPDDPRVEGELLWPSWRNESASKAMASGMGSHRAAAQLQQRPAAREGEILKRNWWRFYEPSLRDDPKRMPKFRVVVQSIDTPQKDKQANDLVAIQAWGVIGADRYLLDLKKGHMNYSQARRAILEQARHVRKLYPHAAHYCLIENAGYGVELIIDLKREIPGLKKLTHSHEGDKIMRAEAASSDLESGNCFLPGKRLGQDELSMPDENNCPADIKDFIDSCALFPNATHDDDVDAWSQCMNWLRSRPLQKIRVSTVSKNRRRSDATRAS